jgi:hypothetical protein
MWSLKKRHEQKAREAAYEVERVWYRITPDGVSHASSHLEHVDGLEGEVVFACGKRHPAAQLLPERGRRCLSCKRALDR